MDAQPEEAYWLDTKDRHGLFGALARELVGNAHMSIMGRIKGLNLEDIPGAAKAETAVLRHQTLFSIPREDFIVLPVEPETVEIILARIPAECWNEFRITHVQIEKDGKLEFSGCDYFDVNSTWVGDAVSENLLAGLVSNGILNRFQRDIFANEPSAAQPRIRTLRVPLLGMPRLRIWKWFRRDDVDAETNATLKVIQHFNEVFNRHDMDAVMAAMTEDVVFENTSPAPDGDRYEGQASVREFWERLFQSSARAHFETEEIFAGADRCTVRWLYTLSNDDGSSGHVRGVDIFRVRDGKVAEKLSYVKG